MAFSAATDGGVECSICQAGTFSHGTNAMACEPCRPGRVAIALGMAECEECPLGEFASDEGATACELCTPGEMACTRQPDARSSAGGYQMAHDADTGGNRAGGNHQQVVIGCLATLVAVLLVAVVRLFCAERAARRPLGLPMQLPNGRDHGKMPLPSGRPDSPDGDLGRAAGARGGYVEMGGLDRSNVPNPLFSAGRGVVEKPSVLMGRRSKKHRRTKHNKLLVGEQVQRLQQQHTPSASGGGLALPASSLDTLPPPAPRDLRTVPPQTMPLSALSPTTSPPTGPGPGAAALGLPKARRNARDATSPSAQAAGIPVGTSRHAHALEELTGITI